MESQQKPCRLCKPSWLRRVEGQAFLADRQDDCSRVLQVVKSSITVQFQMRTGARHRHKLTDNSQLLSRKRPADTWKKVREREREREAHRDPSSHIIAGSARVARNDYLICINNPSIHPSARPPARPPVHPSIRPSVHPCVCPSVRSSTNSSIHPFTRPSFHPNHPEGATWNNHAHTYVCTHTHKRARAFQQTFNTTVTNANSIIIFPIPCKSIPIYSARPFRVSIDTP